MFGATNHQCEGTAYERDTYRVARGKGFEMHYIRRQCKRYTKEGERFCWQHKWYTGETGYIRAQT